MSIEPLTNNIEKSISSSAKSPMLFPDPVALLVLMEPESIPEPKHSALISNIMIFPEIIIPLLRNSVSHIAMVVSSTDGINEQIMISSILDVFDTTTTPVCEFVFKKDEVKVVNSSRLIVEEVDGAINCCYVPLYTQGAGYATIQDLISNVHDSHKDASSSLWQEVCSSALTCTQPRTSLLWRLLLCLLDSKK